MTKVVAPFDASLVACIWASAVALSCAPAVPATPSRAVHSVRLIGRWDRSDPARPGAANAGVRLAVEVHGRGLAVTLDEAPRLGNDWFSVRVDGSERRVFEASAGVREYVLVDDLEPGVHRIEVAKRTEASVGAFRLVAVRAIDGALVPMAEAHPSRASIEFVGDSNTVGYGNEGDGPGCAFSPATENHERSFAAVLARSLGAEWSAVAVSGRGLLRNYDGSTTGTIPELYGRIDPFDARSRVSFDAPHPEIIVVALGQNDFVVGREPPREEALTGGMSRLLQRLRSVHPKAWLVVVVPPGTHDDAPEGQGARSHLRAAYAAAVRERVANGDSQVTLEEPAEATKAELTGCDFHLSVAAHARVARELEPRLRAKLGR